MSLSFFGLSPRFPRGRESGAFLFSGSNMYDLVSEIAMQNGRMRRGYTNNPAENRFDYGCEIPKLRMPEQQDYAQTKRLRELGYSEIDIIRIVERV